MLSKKRKLISLIIIVILTFIIGMRYEIDYRILTRRTVKYLANYELGYYGGKGFRIFETDIAFILTLIPIGFYFTSRKIRSIKKVLWLNFVYLILVPIFYCLFCFLESQFINITVTNPIMNDGILKYHQNNLNYRMILFFTIISTFISGIIIKKITKEKKPVANTV
jgi:dolichyl-phosphate-mannose--protein O-mannosyl transferase